MKNFILLSITITVAFISGCHPDFTGSSNDYFNKQEWEEFSRQLNQIAKKEGTTLEIPDFQPNTFKKPWDSNDPNILSKKLETEIRPMLKGWSKSVKEMEIQNQINKIRVEQLDEAWSKCANRRDSLDVALDFPDIYHFGDYEEVKRLGLWPRDSTRRN